MSAINKEPYEKCINLREVVLNKCYLSEVGWSEDKGYYFRGRYYTDQQLAELFPTTFKYSTVQLDKKQLTP